MVALSDLPFNPTDNSVGASAAQDLVYGDNQQAVGWQMLENMPNASSVMGWNAWRASNTVAKARGMHISSGGSVLNTFSPRRYTKMRSYDNIGGTNNAYSPFNFLAPTANKALNWAGERDIFKGKVMEGDEDFFARGTYARLSTAQRVSTATAGTKRGDRALRGAQEFLQQTDADRWAKIASRFDSGLAPGEFGPPKPGSVTRAMTADDMGHFVASSSKSTYSNMISGYMRGARSGIADDLVGRGLFSASYEKGAAKAAEHIALGAGKSFFAGGGRAAFEALDGAGAKLGMKGVAKFGGATAAKAVGAAIPGVNVAMAVWTAVDITKMLLSATKQIPGFTRDALNSFKGGIQKPVFGTRYVDNSVAATSRQRGQMAIQQSALNMRSVLGHEASGLSSYF